MSTVESMKVPQPESINLRDVTNLTARLAQVLAEEVDHLGAMKIKKVQALQQEKLFLTSALEAHRRQITRNPHLLDAVPSQDKRDLEGVVRVFEDILKENHKRLQMARDVNRAVVDTITQVVKESAGSKVYGERGVQGALGNQALSITYNQTA